MKVSNNQRRLSNVKLTRKFHFNYLGWWIIISIMYVALLDVAVYFIYDQMWRAYTPTSADPTVEHLLLSTNRMFTLFCFTIIFIAAIVILAVTTAHRIAGPYLALERTCHQIRKGDLDARIRFRKSDGLDHVESAFNGLVQELQNQLDRERSKH